VVYWIYTTVVRPIVTYAAIIWWPRVKLKRSQAELSKLQMMACLRITGAMRTAATAAMVVLLGLPTLHLQVEVEAKIGNYRYVAVNNGNPNLKVLDTIHDSGLGKEPILQMGSDNMIPRHVYDKPFTIRFPDF
jgi:hypothetical protein